VLHLHSKTSPEWGVRAVAEIDTILIDHAHLEKKAASTALTLIFRNTDRPQMLVPLSELAREEMRHFEMVLGHIRARGGELKRLRPSPYPGRLLEAVRQGSPLTRLIDTLLCCALIEARSCERMQLLAAALDAGPLKDMYNGLLTSEARHHMLYIDLAETIAPTEEVRARLAQLADHEASIIADPAPEPRMHN
jgi:tRNA-(ms[2]io[6]A)-hydroxylase